VLPRRALRTTAIPTRIDRVSRPDPRVFEELRRADLAPRERLRACALLIGFGEIGTAVTHLAALMDVPACRPRALQLFAQCQQLKALEIAARAAPPRARASQRAGEEDGFWAAPAGSETTVLAFTGRAKRLGMSTYFFDRLLAPHGVNAIYLFDWKDALFLGGVNGLGDSLAETVASLRRKCAEMGTRRLICLGQSAGGYAAIRYGLELGADAVMAISPTVAQPMSGMPLRRIRATLGDNVDAADLDLRVWFGRRSPTPRTWVIFGAGCAADAQSARVLAGLPGVVVQPISGFDHHAILAPLVVSGRFSSLLAGICEEVGPGRWRPDAGATASA